MSAFRKLLPVVALGGAVLAAQAQAATFVATRFDDPLPNACFPTDCSLREAVAAANATAAQDTIVLARGEYVLSQTQGGDVLDLDITRPLRIVGQGIASSVIRYAGNPGPDGRVIEVRETSLDLVSLGLRDGYANFGFGTVGGCVYAYSAQLMMQDVEVRNCRVYGSGGGLQLTSSSVRFTDVVIRDNAANTGAGVALQGTTLLTASRTWIQSNEASQNGGAFAAVAWPLAATTSTLNFGDEVVIEGNVAGQGGGIAVNPGVNLVLQPLNTQDPLTIEANLALGAGGGLWIGASSGSAPSGSLVGRRLSLRSNLTDGVGGGAAAFGRLRLYDSEVRENVAQRDGAGVYVDRSAARSVLERVALTGNVATESGGGAFIAGEASLARNVSSYRNAAASGGGFQVEAPMLMTHVTSLDDAASDGPSLHALERIDLRGSVFAAGCSFGGSGALIDLVGNFESDSASPCGLAAQSPAAFALGFGDFGSGFDVVGILDPTSVLIDALPQQPNAAVDVRGWIRGAAADSGAFEFGASP